MRWLREIEASSRACKDVALPWVEWEIVQRQGKAVARLDIVSLETIWGPVFLQRDPSSQDRYFVNTFVV